MTPGSHCWRAAVCLNLTWVSWTSPSLVWPSASQVGGTAQSISVSTSWQIGSAHRAHVFNITTRQNSQCLKDLSWFSCLTFFSLSSADANCTKKKEPFGANHSRQRSKVTTLRAVTPFTMNHHSNDEQPSPVRSSAISSLMRPFWSGLWPTSSGVAW